MGILIRVRVVVVVVRIRSVIGIVRRRIGEELRVGIAEDGPEANGEPADLLQGNAAKEVEDLRSGEPLRVAGDTLASICRPRRDGEDQKSVENHLLLPTPTSSTTTFLRPKFMKIHAARGQSRQSRPCLFGWKGREGEGN
ncbi:unnamed protein product [Victoria cruziana]